MKQYLCTDPTTGRSVVVRERDAARLHILQLSDWRITETAATPVEPNQAKKSAKKSTDKA